MMNLALTAAGIVAFVGARYVLGSPELMRRAAALLIRQAARVEAARAAAQREGDKAYSAACNFLGVEDSEVRNVFVAADAKE